MKKHKLLIAFLIFFGFAGVFIPAFSSQAKTIKVIVALANVRLKPDFNSQVISQIVSGTLLEPTAKMGEWYQISVTPNEKGGVVTGYIHQSTVQEIQATAKPAAEPPPAKVPQPVPVQQEAVTPPPSERERPAVSGQSLFSGFFIKFGWMNSPPAGGLDKSWLLSLGYDFGLGRNLAFGIELQPAYRSYSDIDLTLLPLMGFANVKLGENAGRLIRFMRFLNVYGGAGLGLEGTYSKIVFEGQTYTDFRTLFGFHILFGGEIVLNNVRLLLDYQLARISDPNVDPNFWRHYLLFGVKF